MDSVVADSTADLSHASRLSAEDTQALDFSHERGGATEAWALRLLGEIVAQHAPSEVLSRCGARKVADNNVHTKVLLGSVLSRSPEYSNSTPEHDRVGVWRISYSWAT